MDIGPGGEAGGHGHSRALAAIADFRAPTIGYLGQVARSAEQLGYEAVLTPTGTWCEDAWIFSGGRLLLNIVTGGDPAEQRRFGDHLGHDQRYERTEEFLAALRGVSAAGYGLVRGGAGTALVGSHAEVADPIEEYHGLGIDHFILSGQPHLEEAYYFAEGAAAELRHRGLLPAPA